MSADDAAEAADVLTMTDLRGVETHGVSSMLRMYVRDYKAGKLDPRPGWRVVRESPATAVIDAGRRLGIIAGPRAMRLAVDKARAVGVGVVTVFNSGHFGAIGHYAMQAASQNMVGVCFTGAGLSVVPTFASKPAAAGLGDGQGRRSALPTMLVPGSGSKNHFAAYHIEAFTDLDQFKDTKR